MVATRSDGRLVHTTFSELPRFLEPGDLVVVNTSGTLAAALDAIAPDGEPVTVHLSTRLPADLWVVELRRGTAPHRDARPGWVLQLADTGVVELLAPYARSNGRLWVASVRL